MKKYISIILILGIIGYLIGCGKKQQYEEIPEPMSIEELSTFSAESELISEPGVALTQGAMVTEALPPPGPYKPQPKEIQMALREAGFYTWTIDGKIGPMTKKAIEEFQKANRLKVDGIVGPKTWAILKTYLKPSFLPGSDKKQ